MEFQNGCRDLLLSTNEPLLYRGESFPDSILCQVGNGMQVKLSHDLPAMGFNSFYADVEVGGDLFC